MFENVNILPNVMYHYDKNLTNYTNEDPDYESKYQRHQDYLALIDGIDIDNDTINSDDPTYTLVGSSDNDAVVLFRNSNGELRRRCPIDGNEYSKSQFAYVPQGYTTNTNLQNAFTFRYNLPKQVNLNVGLLRQEGITDWPDGNYGNNYSPENRPELWPYYTQYFLTVDESISWNRIYNMNSTVATERYERLINYLNRVV